MTIKKLNPNNPVVQAADGHWMKIAAVLVHRLGGDVTLTDEDFAAFPDNATLALGEVGRTIILKLVDPAEAQRLLAKHGGRPN